MKRAGDFLFVSGTSARRADNTIAGAEVDELGDDCDSIFARRRAPLSRISAIFCRALGADLQDVVEITTYLVNMNDFGGYNEVYGEYFRIRWSGADNGGRPPVAASASAD